MFKILILLTFIFLSLSQAMARVDVRWFTVASVVIEDEDTQVMFDPMFTRATIWNWLNLSKLKADEPLVASVLKEHQLNKIKGIFASHAHFDHSVDAPIVARLTGGVFYVDPNTKIIAEAYKSPEIKTQDVENLKSIQIGKFKITVMKRTHAHIRTLGINFLKGPVNKDFDFNFYDYQMGDTWFYLIEHPEGKILLDQGSEPFVTTVQNFTDKVDVVIQGVANRPSDEATSEGYVKQLSPKVFIVTHFDNFIFSFDPKGSFSYLPGVRLDDVVERLKKDHPDKKIIVPEYGKRIQLFP
jgi:L-ascorbate metabolism protein UlaG (beta-lactamase superfamily)